jgi:hypothetical protein
VALRAKITEKQMKIALNILIDDYVNWLFTRRFYAPKDVESIIGKLGIVKVGQVPNAHNSPLCAAFNLVLNNALESDDEEFDYFISCYFKSYGAKQAKELASDTGVTLTVVYYHAGKAATRYYNTSCELLEAHFKIQREVEGYYD